MLADLFGAEWLKLRSLRSTYWLLVGGVGLTVGAALFSLRHVDLSSYGRSVFDPLGHAYDPRVWGLVAVGAAVVGALTLVGEYRSGLIRTTFAAVPARRGVVAAKALVVLAAMLVAGAVLSVGAFTASQAALTGQRLAIAPTDPSALRAIIASALLPAVCALVGMGVGALIRHAVGCVLALIVLLVGLPDVLRAVGLPWARDLMPATAWDRLVVLRVSELPGGTGPGVVASWVALAVWPLLAVAVALLVVDRVDT